MLNISHIFNYVNKYINSFQKYIFIEKLVVVVEKNRSVGHRREADSWDADLAEVARVRAGGEYLRLHVEVVLLEGSGHCGEPGVLLVHGGEGLVRELDQELQLDVAASLRQPASQHVLELLELGGRRDADVEVDDKLVRHHVDLHAALHQRQVDRRHVAEGQLGVRLQPELLLRPELEQSVDHLLRLLRRGVLQEPAAVTRAAVTRHL